MTMDAIKDLIVNNMAFWGLVMGVSGITLLVFFIYFSSVIKHINFIFFKRKKGRAFIKVLEDKYPGQYFSVSPYDWKLLDYRMAAGFVKAIKITGLVNSFILETDNFDRIYFVLKDKSSVVAWEKSISDEITRVKELNNKAYNEKMYNSI